MPNLKKQLLDALMAVDNTDDQKRLTPLIKELTGRQIEPHQKLKVCIQLVLAHAEHPELQGNKAWCKAIALVSRLIKTSAYTLQDQNPPPHPKP